MFVPYDDRGFGEPEESEEPEKQGASDFWELGFLMTREFLAYPFCFGTVLLGVGVSTCNFWLR